MNERRIEDFLTFLQGRALSHNRILKYRSTLRTLSSKLNKDFSKVTKLDMVKTFAEIEGKEEYAENTKRDFKVVAKVFWRWLKDTEADPPETAWLRTTFNKRLARLIRTKDCLTEEEVYKMVDSAASPRDKAIISLLYESASRIGEMVNLKVSDIVFDENGYNFVTTGKTGDVYKRVINEKAVRLLKEWMAQHPFQDDGNAALWICLKRANLGRKSLGFGGIRKMLREIGAIAGMTKRVNPHSFRHARITNLRVLRKVPDAIIESLVGWKPGTNMFDTYQHETSEDVDDALIKVYGLRETRERQRKVEKLDGVMIELFKSNPQFRRIVMAAATKGLK